MANSRIFLHRVPRFVSNIRRGVRMDRRHPRALFCVVVFHRVSIRLFLLTGAEAAGSCSPFRTSDLHSAHMDHPYNWSAGRQDERYNVSHLQYSVLQETKTKEEETCRVTFSLSLSLSSRDLLRRTVHEFPPQLLAACNNACSVSPFVCSYLSILLCFSSSSPSFAVRPPHRIQLFNGFRRAFSASRRRESDLTFGRAATT
jgi:hypothetical protein